MANLATIAHEITSHVLAKIKNEHIKKITVIVRIPVNPAFGRYSRFYRNITYTIHLENSRGRFEMSKNLFRNNTEHDKLVAPNRKNIIDTMIFANDPCKTGYLKK